MFERPRLKLKIVAMMSHGSLEGSSWPSSTASVLKRAYLPPQLTIILLWTIISVVLLNCQAVTIKRQIYCQEPEFKSTTGVPDKYLSFAEGLKLPSTTKATVKRKSYHQIPNSPSSTGVKNQNCGPESQFHSVMAFILRTEKPPYLVRVNVGNSRTACDSTIRTDRYYSRLPQNIWETLSDAPFRRLNESIKSVEDVADCIGTTLVDLQIENKTLHKHKVLITTKESILSLGTITLFGFGANIHFRTQKFSLTTAQALTELQLSKIFKSQYGENEDSQISSSTTSRKRCFSCDGFGHLKYSCPNEVSKSRGSRQVPYTREVASTGPSRQNISVITLDGNERQHPISQRQHSASYSQGTGLSTASAIQGACLENDSFSQKSDSLSQKSDSLSQKSDSLSQKSGPKSQSGPESQKSGPESSISVPDSQISVGAALSQLNVSQGQLIPLVFYNKNHVPESQLSSSLYYNQDDIPSCDEDTAMNLDEKLLQDIEQRHSKELLKQQENVASNTTASTGESLPLSTVTMIPGFSNNKENLSKQAMKEDRKNEDGIESTSKSQDCENDERDIFES